MSLLLIVIALVALMALAVEGRVRFPVLNRVVTVSYTHLTLPTT